MSQAALRDPPLAPGGDQATRLRALIDAAEAAAARADRFELPPARDPVRRAKVVTVSSGKGGVGKTNACVNLAIALAQAGKRTILLDADLGMANADVLCGLSPARRLEHYVGVTDLAPNGRPRTPMDAGALARRSLTDLAIDAPGGFRLIPGAVGVARMASLGPRERSRLMAGLAELERDADVLLVDTGAGLGRDVITFIHAADLALVIATPEPTSIADAYALIKCALRGDIDADRASDLRMAPESLPRLALVVNQAADAREAAQVHARIAGVCERFLRQRLPLLGWVSQDPKVGAAVRQRRPVLLACAKCAASRDLRALAAALTQALEPHRAPDPPVRGISGWLARIGLGRS